ncbi:6999_t:CDS:1, partial [Funneliformis caledonium]
NGKYLKEIGKRLPRKHSIQVQRWPSQNGLKLVLTLQKQMEDSQYFMALARIYRFFYNPPLPLTERKAWKA